MSAQAQLGAQPRADGMTLGDVTAAQAQHAAQPRAAGMRTLVEVVARRGPGGRTLLPVVRTTGQLTVRRTGEYRIHLVATAFGPLGGDAVVVRLHVEPGVRLEVRSVAAAVCLPSPERTPSTAELCADVAAGARLDIQFEPTVVAAGAEHRSRTEISLAENATVRVTERIVLGRHAEEPGHWTGTTRIERAGRPLLHTTVDLGPGSAMWRPPTTPRAYATDVVLDDLEPGALMRPGTGPAAVLLPLVGGYVSTAWGERLGDVLASRTELPMSASTQS